MGTLTTRQLNRALLERQLLLDRSGLSAAAAIAHLVGMQAQSPPAPYYGLWARLEGFEPEQLSKLIAGRQVVRATLMRATIHLVGAEDCLELRPLVTPVLERDVYPNQVFGRHRLEGLDVDAVLDAGRRLVEETPRTAGQLRELLAPLWLDREPAALAYLVRQLLPLVHVPPRGLWRSSGLPTFTTVEAWLGRSVAAAPSIERIILRYLAAYGPASVADVQVWSGLTRLREAVDSLRPQLRSFQDENGRELFDLPDAPLPDADSVAPVRFLPEFDNALYSHADRVRIVPDKSHLRQARNRGLVLLDGFTCAAWRAVRQKGAAAVEIEVFEPLAGADRVAVTEEAARLLVSAAPGDEHDVRFVASWG